MSKRITYLLGAGASANSIPVVEKFNEGIRSFLNELGNLSFGEERFNDPFDKDIPYSKQALADRVRKSCFNILNEAQKHVTIDTYARKLFLTEREVELRELKALISIYLIKHQLQHAPDQRYDVFLATLLNRKEGELFLPPSINLITWNYDFQLERSLVPFIQTGSMNRIQQALNVFPNESSTLNKDSFHLIKLNGTALGWLSDANSFKSVNFNLLTDYKENSISVWEGLLSFFYWTTQPENTAKFALSFAWEDDSFITKSRSSIKNVLPKTEILVVIGYSFPTFNRALDMDILRKMTQLKKVIIQTMEDNADQVESRLRSILGKNRLQKIKTQGVSGIDLEIIKMKSGKEEFYIPFEFQES